MNKLTKILFYLRPGIRGKLSLFIGIMLFAMVGVTLAIVLKQQYVTLSDLSQKEIERFLSPVDSMTREIVHYSENLIRLERLKKNTEKKSKRKVGTKKLRYDFNAFFSEKQIKNADDRLRNSIKPSKTADSPDEEQYKKYQSVAKWLSLYKKNNKISKQKNLNLERLLRQALNYDSRVKISLAGLDLTKHRIESVDLGRWIRFDSRQMLSWVAGKAPINQISWNKKGDTDEFRKELDRIYSAWSKDNNPFLKTSRLEYSDNNAAYILLTRTLFSNPDVTNRARTVLSLFSSGSGWKRYILSEKKVNAQLKEISLKIKKRRLEIQEENKIPRFDIELKKLKKEYLLGLDTRKKNLNEYLMSMLKQYEQGYLSLEKEIADMTKELKNPIIKKDKIKLKELIDKRKELYIKRNETGFTKIHQQADAFENLRYAALYHKVVMLYNFDRKSHYDYINSSGIRNLQQRQWKAIRDWIFSYRSEIYINSRAIRAREGMLTKTRTQAEEIMWEIDALSLTDLAKQVLYENTIGFNRILVDQTESIRKVQIQRDRLLDTTLSIGLRILFVAFLLSWYFVQAIQSIIRGAGRVGHGDLSVRFEYDGSDELGTLVTSLNHMVKDLKEREELRSELSAAEEIQKRLLPIDMPSNMEGHLEFGAFYKAMSGVGGDYYDFLQAGKDKFIFCIADVSNHGVGPAIIMTLLRSQLHGIVLRGVIDPRKVLSELNDRIYKDTPSNIFITMFLGVYDKKTGEIVCCSAGHNLAFMSRSRGKKLSKLQITGMPLGAVESELFDSVLETGKTVLRKGDLFFQYTDGVNEAMDQNSEQYGMERMATILEKNGALNPQELVTKVAKEVEVFSGKEIFCEGPSQLNDDIAMIAFRRVK